MESRFSYFDVKSPGLSSSGVMLVLVPTGQLARALILDGRPQHQMEVRRERGKEHRIIEQRIHPRQLSGQPQQFRRRHARLCLRRIGYLI
jgi:hypothetical protein